MIIRLKSNDKYEILRTNRYGEPFWAPHTCIWHKEFVVERHKKEYLHGFMVVNGARYTTRIKKKDFPKETLAYLSTKEVIYTSKLPTI